MLVPHDYIEDKCPLPHLIVQLLFVILTCLKDIEPFSELKLVTDNPLLIDIEPDNFVCSFIGEYVR